MINIVIIDVFIRMYELLESSDFSLDAECLKEYHGFIFKDVLENAGKYREINVYKDEPILDSETVKYANYQNIEDYIKYDLEAEKNKKYNMLSKKNIIDNITDLSVRLWSTHPFFEGNTRVLSVFIRNYLRQKGIKCDNNFFLDYFSYYRNALVMASYSNSFITGNDSYLKDFYDRVFFHKNKELQEIKKLVKKRDLGN